jgi:hypothetical protein
VRPRVPASNEGGVIFFTNYVKDFEGRFCDLLEILDYKIGTSSKEGRILRDVKFLQNITRVLFFLTESSLKKPLRHGKRLSSVFCTIVSIEGEAR